MLDLHKKLPAAGTPYENDSLKRQIDAADAENLEIGRHRFPLPPPRGKAGMEVSCTSFTA
jgi:hypothetical protein